MVEGKHRVFEPQLDSTEFCLKKCFSQYWILNHRCWIGLCQFPKIKKCESRFFLTSSKMRNCELKITNRFFCPKF